MRSFIPFLSNRPGKLKSFSVDVKVETRHYKGVPKRLGREYKSLVAKLIEFREGGSFLISELDTARDDLWGGALERILLNVKSFLNDSRSYKFRETRKEIADYWHAKQKASVEQQKKERAKTVYTPAGDYTLWRIAEFLTYLFDIKYENLKDKSIFSELKRKKLSDFEKNFTELVLTPVQNKNEIRTLINSKKSPEAKAKGIIDILVTSKMRFLGSYEDILEPEFKDDAPLLSQEDDKELGALWKIYEEEKQKLENDKKLSETEKRLIGMEFWDSPQGERLNQLNNRRSHGGGLTFEEREQKKRNRAREICGQLEHLLLFWEADNELIDKAQEYYLYLFERRAIEKWKQEKQFRESIDRAKVELKFMKEALKGNWDSNSLTLLGVILGISISIGLGVASLAPCYKAESGIAGAVLSTILFVLALKVKYTRRKMISLMNKILK